MNTRPAFSAPDPEVEATVEVPAVGTLVVEEGEQYAADAVEERYAVCLCRDNQHRGAGQLIVRHTRAAAHRLVARAGGHVVTLHTVTVVMGGAA